MKSLTEHLWFETKERMEFVNITDRVADAVRRSGVKEGLVLVNAMHIGPWEQVFCGEFDGRRRKRVLLKVVGE